MSRIILLTGSTGNLGAPLLRRMLQNPEISLVYALVRASSEAEGLARVIGALTTSTGAIDLSLISRKLRVFCGDITTSNLGLSAGNRRTLISSVTDIVHAAAQTQFTLPLEEARRCNCLGTRHIAELAREIMTRGALGHFFHISTAYVCGLTEGKVEEKFQTASNFSNSYEQTKYETEMILRREYADLPGIILRPSIIAGDSHTGRILTCNVLYTPLRWILHGYLHGPFCQAETPLDVVSVDYVADAVIQLLLHSGKELPSPIHLAAGDSNSMTVREVVQFTLDYAGRQKFLMPARQCKRGEYLAVPYYPYMTIRRSFDVHNSRMLLVPYGIMPRPLSTYLGHLLDYAFQTNWAKSSRGRKYNRQEVAPCAV